MMCVIEVCPADHDSQATAKTTANTVSSQIKQIFPTYRIHTRDESVCLLEATTQKNFHRCFGRAARVLVRISNQLQAVGRPVAESFLFFLWKLFV